MVCIDEQVAAVHLVLVQAKIPFAYIIFNRYINDAVSSGAVAGGYVAAQIAGISSHTGICELQARQQAVSCRFLTFGQKHTESKHQIF